MLVCEAHTHRSHASRQISTVPYPLLGENTFVVSDTACVCTVDGVLTLMWRVGDTYANQMVEAHARAYVLRCVDCLWCHSCSLAGGLLCCIVLLVRTTNHIHPSNTPLHARWQPSAEEGYTDYTQKELELGFSHKGEDRLLLRLPHIVCHVIDETSPLAAWRDPAGRMTDADADLIFLVRMPCCTQCCCCVVMCCVMCCVTTCLCFLVPCAVSRAAQVEGYWYCNRQNAVRMKTYNVLNSVKFDHKFVNIITPPNETHDFKPRVDWSRSVVHVYASPTSTTRLQVSRRRQGRGRACTPASRAPDGGEAAHEAQHPATRCATHATIVHQLPFFPRFVDRCCGLRPARGAEPAQQRAQHAVCRGSGNVDDWAPAGAHSADGDAVQLSQRCIWAGVEQLHGGGAGYGGWAAAVCQRAARKRDVAKRCGRWCCAILRCARRLTDYDESLAMMTRSPDHRVPYNRLTSLFEAAEAMEAMQRAAAEEARDDGEAVPFVGASTSH